MLELKTHLWQFHDEIVRVRVLGSAHHLVEAHVSATVANVLNDGRVEEHRLLVHNAQILAQPLDVQRANVTTIDEQSALSRIVEALEELNARRLAASRRADQSDRLTGRDCQAQIVERSYLGSRRIAERDTAKLDVTAHLLRLQAVR